MDIRDIDGDGDRLEKTPLDIEGLVSCIAVAGRREDAPLTASGSVCSMVSGIGAKDHWGGTMGQRFIWLSAVFAVWLWAPAEAAAKYLGREFPNFTATDAVTRERFTLRELRGKVVVVDFWATWCGPCVREVPNLKRAHDKYKKQGLEIVSISLDSDKGRFSSFVRSKRMTWRHVMDGGGWKTRLARKFGVNSIPRMYVIDPAGVCIAENVRGRSLDNAIKKGLALIEDREPPVATRTRQAPPRVPRQVPQESSSPPRRGEPPELKAARAALTMLASPMEQLERTMTTLEGDIERIERDLPVPKDPARTERRAARLCADLADLRHRMFMLGLVDGESAPVLPPFEPAGVGASSTWSRVNPLLLSARDALEQLRGAVSDTRRRLADLDAKIAAAATEYTRGASDDAMGRRVKEIQEHAAALRLGEPMLGQLVVAQQMIAGCCRPFDEVGMMLGALDDRIAQMRETLDGTPRETEALRALRDAFAGICTDLTQAARSMGLEEAQLQLPADPFAGRRLRDRRVLAEMAVQVDLAQQAAASLHSLVVERRSRYDELSAEMTTLQGEIADRLEAGAAVEDLDDPYATLTREVLVLHDTSRTNR